MGAPPPYPRGLYAQGLPVNKKQRAESPLFHRISCSKRRVAPQRCPVYATIIVLTNLWMIIPFTLINVHNHIRKNRYRYSLPLNVFGQSLNDPAISDSENFSLLFAYDFIFSSTQSLSSSITYTPKNYFA